MDTIFFGVRHQEMAIFGIFRGWKFKIGLFLRQFFWIFWIFLEIHLLGGGALKRTISLLLAFKIQKIACGARGGLGVPLDPRRGGAAAPFRESPARWCFLRAPKKLPFFRRTFCRYMHKNSSTAVSFHRSESNSVGADSPASQLSFKYKNDAARLLGQELQPIKGNPNPNEVFIGASQTQLEQIAQRLSYLTSIRTTPYASWFKSYSPPKFSRFFHGCQSGAILTQIALALSVFIGAS